MHELAIQIVTKYKQLIEGEFQREGIAFRAAILSQAGRPGKDAREVVEALARMADTNAHPGPTHAKLDEDLTMESIPNSSFIWSECYVCTCIPPPRGETALVCRGVHQNQSDETIEILWLRPKQYNPLDAHRNAPRHLPVFHYHHQNTAMAYNSTINATHPQAPPSPCACPTN